MVGRVAGRPSAKAFRIGVSGPVGPKASVSMIVSGAPVTPMAAASTSLTISLMPAVSKASKPRQSRALAAALRAATPAAKAPIPAAPIPAPPFHAAPAKRRPAP